MVNVTVLYDAADFLLSDESSGILFGVPTKSNRKI